MSLDYDLTRVKTRDAYPPGPDDMMNHVTQGLIFATLATGLGEISEQNAEEFYFRLSFFDALIGASPATRRTYAEVRDHIGLRTNVFPAITRAAFLKRMAANHQSNHVYYALKNYAAAQEKAKGDANV